MDGLSKLVISIEINKVQLQGIIDTGAEYTLLSTYAARKAKLTDKIQSTKERVKGVSGISRLAGYLPDQPVKLGDATLHLDIATLDGGSFDVLIGRDILFCGFKHFSLDSANRKISFKWQGRDHTIHYKNVRGK